MFGTLTLATLLTDADTILALVSPVIVIAVSFWGARKVLGMVKSVGAR